MANCSINFMKKGLKYLYIYELDTSEIRRLSFLFKHHSSLQYTLYIFWMRTHASIDTACNVKQL